jgi:hypothetical protein
MTVKTSRETFTYSLELWNLYNRENHKSKKIVSRRLITERRERKREQIMKKIFRLKKFVKRK